MVESTLFISLRRRVNKQRCKKNILIVFKANIFGIYIYLQAVIQHGLKII